MKKVLISMGFAALALGATAQVKIKDGTVIGSSTIPSSTAILDLESSNKGLHLPRVSLQATNSPSPLNEANFTTADTGLYVYNLATAGTVPYNVTPGVYYCDGTQWVRVAQGNNWLVFGSSTAAKNGTPASVTDSQYVMGRVGIGVNTMQRLYDFTAGGDSAHKFAYLAVNGDAVINGIVLGRGSGNDVNNLTLGGGIKPLGSNTTGTRNVAIGTSAMRTNTTGSDNVAVGNGALMYDTTGNKNIAIGSGAASNMQGGASSNIAIGNNTLMCLGIPPAPVYGFKRVNCIGNIAIGDSALYTPPSSEAQTYYNVAIGHYSMIGDMFFGGRNVAIGYKSGVSIGSAADTILSNIFIGDSTGFNQMGGRRNIVIGSGQDAYNLGASSNVGTGVGTFSDPRSYNQLNLGGAIFGTGLAGNQNAPAGNIGIDIPQPNSTLQVSGSVSTPAKVVSGAYTLAATDYTVVFTAAGGSVTLPAASATAGTGNAGRVYRIVAQNTTVNIGTAVTGFGGSAVTSITNGSILVQCVNTSTTAAAWMQVGQ